MKISDIKIYTLDAFRTNWAFIKVETDEGLYGWGEASLGTNEMALEGMVQDLKRLIVGRDPLQIEKMLFEVYRDIYWKGGAVLMSAISGIEIALWDIAGKYFNTPTYNLLGGKMRDEVKMYANGFAFSPATTPDLAGFFTIDSIGMQGMVPEIALEMYGDEVWSLFFEYRELCLMLADMAMTSGMEEEFFSQYEYAISHYYK